MKAGWTIEHGGIYEWHKMILVNNYESFNTISLYPVADVDGIYKCSYNVGIWKIKQK